MAIEQVPGADRLSELQDLKGKASLGGGTERIEAQHKRGKLTARERINLLLDEGTFEELDALVTHRSTEFGLDKQKYMGDSVVVGYGKVDGRTVYVYAQDFTVFGGSLSEAAGEKVCKVMDLAIRNGAPIIGLNDGGGARIQEGVVSLKGYGEIFTRNVMASGVVPQISVIMGPTAGGAVYSPAITDFVLMTRHSSYMYITGPDVVRQVMHEDVSHEDLGGAEVHYTKSGVAQFIADTDEDALAETRRLLSFLPLNNAEDPPRAEPGDDPNRRCEGIEALVPEDSSKPYDMHKVIEQIVDDGDFLEVHTGWAKSIVVGLARMGGRVVGIVANNPGYLAGVLDVDSSRKGARFVRFCDAFNIPIVTLVDVPGYMPGTSQEYGGIIIHGAKLLYAYAEATVPRVTIILRKDFGGAYLVMGSKHLRADVNLAWPGAEIAVTGPDAAANIIFRREIEAAADPEAKRKDLIEEYKRRFANPYIAASRGFVDDVIDPRDTRIKTIRALEMLENKTDTNPPKKHGNIPL